MSSFHKLPSVSEIVKQQPKLSQTLLDADNYWAHRDRKGKKQEETLAQHLSLVMSKCCVLSSTHHLDNQLDLLINSYVEDFFPKTFRISVSKFSKEAFIDSILFHDFGKINENFQADVAKMANPHFKKVKSPIDTKHSALGAYIYLIYNCVEAKKLSKGNDEVFVNLLRIVLAFSYPIFKHHGSRLEDQISLKVKFTAEEVAFMKQYLAPYKINVSTDVTNNFDQFLSNCFKHFETFLHQKKEAAPFPLYSLVRLNFSLLTASDYLASGEYMTDLKVDDFGVLNHSRKLEIFQTIQTSKEYNQAVYQELEKAEIINPQVQSNKNLNLLRKEMAIEVIRNVRANIDKNLFYLEAPTGGGKTNLSMLAMVEMLNADKRLNKVFYVFPFTTLITQTHQSIIETLGLKPDEVVQLHSKTGISAKARSEENEDGEYGNKRLNYIDHLFVHYPFCLLTHIRFFDIIKTNEKKTNYLLHRLANSVVVLDELQSYNPAHWDKLVYFIQQYARFYNIKFILMSATLPKLDTLDIPDIDKDVFVPLLPDAKHKYFQNPNFAGRIEFDLKSLQPLPKNKEQALPVLAERVINESKKYADHNFGEAKPRGSVYTIIEFIFKKSATEFYKVIQPLDHGFDEIFVLSGTILEHCRKRIINFLKRGENRKKRVLLITTQVVEAGVDIDMDIGFKNVSLIDSDEQLAGRINRNVNKKHCRLFLFKLNEPSVIYQNDYRFEKTREHLSSEDHLHILQHKDFDRLYNLVLEGVKEWNETEFAAGKLSDYLDDVRRLNFQSVSDKFKLIDQQTLSVFVPLNIPVKVEGEKERSHDTVFSRSEVEFLEKNKISTDKGVNGTAVFDLYLQHIKHKEGEYISKQVDTKTLQSILSKFVFSIFSNEKIKARLVPFTDVEKSEYGYMYLSRWEEIYEEQFGLDESRFDEIENQIL